MSATASNAPLGYDYDTEAVTVASSGVVTNSYAANATSIIIPTTLGFLLPVIAANPSAPYAGAGILTSESAYRGITDTPAAGGHVLTVGTGGQYATLAAAVAAANNGDVIAIRGGTTLTNDFSDITKNITIEGVGGMVNMVATVAPPNEKGILVIDGATVTIKNISFSGVAITDAEGGNGAGIRYDSGNLTIINSDFHNNQNGILANPSPGGSITISHSTFENNGSGSGYTHDIYIGEIANFSITNSIVASANVGHEIKSRADVSVISNNIIADGPTGTGSYNIDLPDGGQSTITGNYIEKGPNAENQVMITVGEEGIPYANTSLNISNNTLVNDRVAGAVGIRNDTLATATVSGNSFSGLTSGNLVAGAANLSSNTLNGAAVSDSAQASLSAGPGIYVYTDSAAHSLVLTDYNMQAQGAGGLLTITSAWGHETVYGGSGGLNYTDTGILANENGDAITTAAGSVNVINVIGQDAINSQGTDTVTLGGGNVTMGVAGTAKVSAGTGSSTFAVSSHASLTLLAQSGSDTLSVASGASASVTGAATYLSTSWSGGNYAFAITQGGQSLAASFVGGGGLATVYNGGLSVTLAAGATNSTTATLTSGAAQLTSTGTDIIHAGSGSDTIIVSGNATIYAGTGHLSVYGHAEAGVATIYGSAASVLIDGDTGGIKYVGGASASSVVDNLSHTELDGGAGRLTITGGGYDRTINGGSGGISLSGVAGGDTITTAAGSVNQISLSGTATIVSNGTDTITCGTGNLSLTANGTATIIGSQGNCTYTLNGTDKLTSFGSDIVNVGAKAVATDTASGTLVTINDAGGTIVLNEIAKGDHVGATVTGVATLVAWGGTGALTVTTQGAASTVVLAGGTDVVHSNGADTITTGTGNDTIYASSKGDSIIIGTASATTVTTIDNFVVGVDHLSIGGIRPTAIAHLTAAVTSLGGWADLHLASGQQVVLTGITVSQFHSISLF